MIAKVCHCAEGAGEPHVHIDPAPLVAVGAAAINAAMVDVWPREMGRGRCSCCGSSGSCGCEVHLMRAAKPGEAPK